MLLVAGFLASSRYPEGPALTGHLGTSFLGFPLSKTEAGTLPNTPVATACFSCSPADLNNLDPYFTFMYMYNNHCHWLLTFILLMWTFGRAPNNASKWEMGFHSVI
jgi:hypothetical protein